MPGAGRLVRVHVRSNRQQMSTQIVIVFGLTFIISLISTLSYSVRIAGIRTGRIAVSLALFSLYAGYLNPELPVTASSLSSVINGLATMLMFVFIDPSLSVLTDDVMEGKATDSFFRRVVVRTRPGAWRP